MDNEERSERFYRELKEVRQTTQDLIESVLWDIWPRNAAIIDFGLDSQQHYEALYYPLLEFEVMPKELDSALGYGERLTALARNAPSNPHKDIELYTSWDGIYNRPRPERALSDLEKLKQVLANPAGDRSAEFDRLLDDAAQRGAKGLDEDKDIER